MKQMIMHIPIFTADNLLLIWLVPEGAAVKVEDPIFTLEFDVSGWGSAEVYVPAPRDRLIHHLVKNLETVECGQAVCTFDDLS